MRKLPSFETGQALLLVLLSMAVVLTVVLSILSRSITDISVTSQEEDALRAFSAAEAGIERALIIGSDIGTTQLGDAEFSASVTSFASGDKNFSYPVNVYSGDSITTWFVGHDDDGDLICSAEKPCFTGDTLKVCWGKQGTSPSDSATPAIELTLFYTETPGNYSTAKIARAAYDPNSSRIGSNNFASPDSGTCTIGSDSFEFFKTVDLTSLGIPAGVLSSENGLQFARVRMFYNSAISHPVGVDVDFAGNSLLPAQGLNIEASGTSGTANRKIQVFRSFGEPPPVFDSVVFAPGGIVK